MLQLIVVSPMVRTLETATGVFGAGPPEDPGNTFMLQLPDQKQWSTQHDAVALPAGIPVISHEGCRERVSKLLILLKKGRVLPHSVTVSIDQQIYKYNLSETRL